MRYFLILLISVLAFSVFADNADNEKIKDNILYFESLRIQEERITIRSKSRIGIIKNGEPDDVRMWKQELDFSVGDTIRLTGGQMNLYWQILKIEKDKVKLRYYGFLRGIGTIDEIFWIREF